jgi:UDP-glucose 4-epimerase
MRILITGGAGFIGSHLAEELLARGHAVHVLDDLSTGSLDNVRHLRQEPRFTCTIDSCHDSRVVAEAVDAADYVCHLAAAVGVQLIVDSPVRTIETNVHCTEIVLQQASRNRRPVFIASTSEVYGKSSAVPFREDGDIVMGATTRGRWSYACSKALDEFLAIAYHRERGLPVVIGRMFNTVGPRQTDRYGMVLPTFVRQALAGQPLTVFGPGTQRRCFCHVRDVVRGLADMLGRDDLYGEVFNLGATEEISMLDLAHRVIALTQASSEIVFVPYQEAYGEGFEDMSRRVPDTTKIRGALGWEPTTRLDEIIRDVVRHELGVVHTAAMPVEMHRIQPTNGSEHAANNSSALVRRPRRAGPVGVGGSSGAGHNGDDRGGIGPDDHDRRP